MSMKAVDFAVQSLRPLCVEDVGGKECLQVVLHCERLALQLQQPALSDVVVQAIHLHDKIPVLVENLLVMEVWKRFVLRPFGMDEKGTPTTTTTTAPTTAPTTTAATLASRLGENKNAIRCRFLLNFESTLVVLLNAALLDSLSRVKEGTIVGIIDYCARCMDTLLDRNDEVCVFQRQQQTLEVASGGLGDIQIAYCESSFRSCVAASTVLARNIFESLESLSEPIQDRVLHVHQFGMKTVSLLEDPPWTRKTDPSTNKAHKWEKFVDNQWTTVLTRDVLTLTQHEGACWINLFLLTCTDVARHRYRWNDGNKSKFLRLRKVLSVDRFVGQLSVLEDLQRYSRSLEDMNVPVSLAEEGNPMGTMDKSLAMLDTNRDWDMIVRKSFDEHFASVSDESDGMANQMAMLHINGDSPFQIPLVSTRSTRDNEAEREGGRPSAGRQVPSVCFSKPILLELCRSCSNGAGDSTEDEKDSTDTVKYVCSSVDDGTLTETVKHGLFRRRNLVVETEEGVPLVACDGRVVVVVPLIDAPPMKIVLKSLSLPESGEARKGREWCKIGNLNSGFVLQVGLLPHESGSYIVDKVVVSSSVDSTCC